MSAIQLVSASNSNGISVVQPNAVRSPVNKLYPVVMQKIFAFLPLGDVVRSKATSKMFKTGFTLWEKETGTVNAKLRSAYMWRHSPEAGKGKIDPRVIEETRKVARGITRLELQDYKLQDLLTFFASPKMECDEDRLFPNAKFLDLNLMFSRQMMSTTPQGRRRGASAPINKESVHGLLKSISFHCPNLTHICLRDSTQDAALMLVEGFNNLEHLEIRESFLNLNPAEPSDQGDPREVIKLCPKLNSLTFDCCDSDDKLRKISTIKMLREVSCLLEGISDDGLKLLAGHPSLETVRMSACDRVTEVGIKYLTLIPNLRRLDIGRCNGVQDLSWIGYMKQLRSLKISVLDSHQVHSLLQSLALGNSVEELESSCSFSASDFEAIGKFPSLRKLSLLDLTKGSHKDLVLLSNCKKLEYFTLKSHKGYDGYWSGPEEYTTKGLIDLVQNLPALRELNLRNCILPNVSTSRLEERFCQERPNLLVLKSEKDEKKLEKKEEGKAKS